MIAFWLAYLAYLADTIVGPSAFPSDFPDQCWTCRRDGENHPRLAYRHRSF